MQQKDSSQTLHLTKNTTEQKYNHNKNSAVNNNDMHPTPTLHHNGTDKSENLASRNQALECGEYLNLTQIFFFRNTTLQLQCPQYLNSSISCCNFKVILSNFFFGLFSLQLLTTGRVPPDQYYTWNKNKFFCVWCPLTTFKVAA